MMLDYAAELAPLLSGLAFVLLAISVAGLTLASVDPELSEIYLGDARPVAIAATAAVVLLVVVLVLKPEFAFALAGWIHS